MTDLQPIGAEHPAFLALFHLPGLDLAEPTMQVAGRRLRRIPWEDWNFVENSDDAWRLHLEFSAANHVFWCAFREDFCGNPSEATVIQRIYECDILRLVAALRLHKAGTVIDPRFSTRYLRLRSLNIRDPGLYSSRFFEQPPSPRYRLDENDLADVGALDADLERVAATADPGVLLALRAFAFAYGYGLSAAQQLAFLFSALEAVFGEYRKQNRPTPLVTLGAAAAMVSREVDPQALAAFLDAGTAARGLRNRIAHGAAEATLVRGDPVIMRIENVVRDGLRSLNAFTARQPSLRHQLDDIEVGLGSLPPKLAFQKLLGHAAKGSAVALSALALIQAAPSGS